LGDGELGGGQGEAEVGVGELRLQSFPGGVDDPAVVERGVRQLVDRVPAGVGRHFRVGVGGDQAEERGGEDAGPGHPVRVAEDRELLDVAELAHVHFLGELAADRALHVFAGAEETAGQGPPVRVRFLVALPEQDLQLVVAHLQDSGEHFVTKVPGDFVTNVPISAAGGGVRIRHVFDYKSKTLGAGNRVFKGSPAPVESPGRRLRWSRRGSAPTPATPGWNPPRNGPGRCADYSTSGTPCCWRTTTSCRRSRTSPTTRGIRWR